MEALTLDTGWIEEYERIEKNYNLFYKEDIAQVKLCILYLDEQKEIQKIVKEEIKFLQPSILKKEELIKNIKEKQIVDNIPYTLQSILQFNFTLSPEDIKFFLEDKINETYLININELKDIYFAPTISIFHNLNTLYFIFKRKPKKLNHSNTKKIYITQRVRKTRRKELKATNSN